MSFTLSSTVKHYPSLPFEAVGKTILGSRYELSLVFVGSARAQKLNQKHRQKDYVPNVLSFPLDDTMGEIFINPQVARKEAPDYDLSYDGYIGFLFIHGCLHLKGFDHSDKMEQLEQKYMKQFKFS